MDNKNKILLDNKFLIKSLLGKGATSRVFLVEDSEKKRIYAAKVLLEYSPQYFKLFSNEKEILNHLKEKNIPDIINIIESGEGPININKLTLNKQYIILDYAEKGDLSEYLFLPEKPLKEKHAKYFFFKILEGVQSIHNNKVCHRDLKTQNILLNKNFRPKISDFGFATYITNSKLKDILGTLRYCAPEILKKKSYDGIKVDIFSLGVILFDLVTGVSGGFKQAALEDPLYKFIIYRIYPSFWKRLTRVKDVSEEFKNLYVKMVSYSPEERPSIEDILNGEWLKEIKNISNDEIKIEELELEIYEDFLERENVINKMKNKKLNTETQNDTGGSPETRSLDVDERVFFSNDLIPKEIKKEKEMGYFIELNGDLNPVKFMNNLANKITSEINCTTDVSKKKLKIVVFFEEEDEEEDEVEENNDEIKNKVEEEKNDEKKDKDDDNDEDEGNGDNDETINKKDTIIKIELFKSNNKNHLLRFLKKSGEMEDYYKNLKKIYAIVEKLV